MSLWSPTHWYTVWNGTEWLPTRKLTSASADNWFFDVLEGMQHSPMSNAQMYKWAGAYWQRVR